MGELRVRSVLVTGANRGIGLGLVRHLLGLPNPPEWVFAACRDPKGQRAQELQNLASKHPNLVIVPLEVTKPASIKAAAASIGERLKDSGLNLLINNAGMVVYKTLDTETQEDMAQVYATNTIGPLLLSQAFLPLLKKAAQGSPGSGLSCSKAAIINISSYAGSIQDVHVWEYGQVISYRCSKAALNMLTKCQSLGYREHGILCAVFHPGWVQTDMGNTAGDKPPVTVDESVGGMLKVMSSLSEKDTGTFLDLLARYGYMGTSSTPRHSPMEPTLEDTLMIVALLQLSPVFCALFTTLESEVKWRFDSRHAIQESSRLEKTFRIITSNCQPDPT